MPQPGFSPLNSCSRVKLLSRRPQQQQTKEFGWLHHQSSRCSNIGATTETLNTYSNLRPFCLKETWVLYTSAIFILIDENRSYISGSCLYLMLYSDSSNKYSLFSRQGKSCYSSVFSDNAHIFRMHRKSACLVTWTSHGKSSLLFVFPCKAM